VKRWCSHDRCDFEGSHIHVSELETMRHWKDDEEGTLEGLISKLRDGPKMNPQMEAGKAFAALMEDADDGVADGATRDGWTFTFSADFHVSRPPLREMQAAMPFETPLGTVTLIGHCDSTGGREVHDDKLTEKWDAEKYVDSLQWRAYLLMFDASCFVYDVFVARYRRRNDEIVPGQVTVAEYHRLPFYAYPGMKRDVQRAVEELAAFMFRHLPERFAT
jgi:hypothetical protein